MRFTVMKTYLPMKAFLLAGVLSLAAVSAVQAGGGKVGSDFHSGASAAPACEGTGPSQKTANDGRLFGDRCRVIADDTGPGSPGDHNGRTAEGTHAYPVLADDGPVSAGDHNGRSAALVTDTDQNDTAISAWHPILAGGRGGISGDV